MKTGDKIRHLIDARLGTYQQLAKDPSRCVVIWDGSRHATTAALCDVVKVRQRLTANPKQRGPKRSVTIYDLTPAQRLAARSLRLTPAQVVEALNGCAGCKECGA